MDEWMSDDEVRQIRAERRADEQRDEASGHEAHVDREEYESDCSLCEQVQRERLEEWIWQGPR